MTAEERRTKDRRNGRPDIPTGTEVVYINANGIAKRGTVIEMVWDDEESCRRVKIRVDPAETFGAYHVQIYLERVGIE